MKDWSRHEPKFRYMMLYRLRQDCEYYLRINGSYNCLWARDEQQQIQTMKDILSTFSDEDKPEWVTMEDINELARKICVGVLSEPHNNIF